MSTDSAERMEGGKEFQSLEGPISSCFEPRPGDLQGQLIRGPQRSGGSTELEEFPQVQGGEAVEGFKNQ